MKELIEREVQRRELADNIKLGDGGIREIEFIVQSFQLIRGGQDRRLQGSSLRRALPLLAGVKLLPAAAVAELDAAYVFLRRLENRLQMRADQQVHKLPSDELEGGCGVRLEGGCGVRLEGGCAVWLLGGRGRLAVGTARQVGDLARQPAARFGRAAAQRWRSAGAERPA